MHSSWLQLAARRLEPCWAVVALNRSRQFLRERPETSFTTDSAKFHTFCIVFMICHRVATSIGCLDGSSNSCPRNRPETPAAWQMPTPTVWSGAPRYTEIGPMKVWSFELVGGLGLRVWHLRRTESTYSKSMCERMRADRAWGAWVPLRVQGPN